MRYYFLADEFRGACTFEEGRVYYGERNAIRLTTLEKLYDIGVDTVAFKVGDLATFYTVEKNGFQEVEIDLSDWFKVLHEKGFAGGVFNVVMLIKSGDNDFFKYDEFELEYAFAGLYDMSRIARPRGWVRDAYDSANDYTPNILCPPSKMIFDGAHYITSVADGLQAGFVIYSNDGSRYEVYPDETGLVEFPKDAAVVQYAPSNKLAAIRPAFVGCERVRCFRWTFPNGVTVCHLLKVYDVTDSTANKVEIASTVDAYDVRKGFGQTLEVGLDNLEAYDVWYYGTMATSSKVEMLDEGAGTFEVVNVTTSKVEQPINDEGKRKSIRLTVELDKHAAI